MSLLFTGRAAERWVSWTDTTKCRESVLMYNVVNKTEKFDINNKKDLEAYDAILNDPSCIIIKENREKMTEKEMGDEGRITSMKEYLLLVVTYQKRSIL